MASKDHTFPWVATLFTLVGVLILLSLGTWQKQRLAWKEVILQGLENAYAAEADAQNLSYSDLTDHDSPSFLYGRLVGELLWDQSLLLGPRVFDSKVGKHWLVPMQISEGIVFVNLGWTDQPLDKLLQSVDQGEAEVLGLLRQPDYTDWTPENLPDEDIWYRADLQQIAEVKGLGQVASYILYAERFKGVSLENFPKIERWYPKNNHFYYMCFWYVMAFVLTVIYSLRFFWRRR